MKVLKAWKGLVPLGVLASIAAQQYIPPQATGETFVDLSSFTCEGPPGASILPFMEARRNGEALPPGWSVTDWKGNLKAIRTGLIDPQTGEHQVVITISDGIDDLNYAQVFVGNQLVATATRANGMIQDRSSFATATIPILVPSPPVTVRAEWIADDGELNRRVHHVQ